MFHKSLPRSKLESIGDKPRIILARGRGLSAENFTQDVPDPRIVNCDGPFDSVD